jgi:hypothetical protein
MACSATTCVPVLQMFCSVIRNFHVASDIAAPTPIWFNPVVRNTSEFGMGSTTLSVCASTIVWPPCVMVNPLGISLP